MSWEWVIIALIPLCGLCATWVAAMYDDGLGYEPNEEV